MTLHQLRKNFKLIAPCNNHFQRYFTASVCVYNIWYDLRLSCHLEFAYRVLLDYYTLQPPSAKVYDLNAKQAYILLRDHIVDYYNLLNSFS